MNKIFLSHSSKDKEYVSYIAERFGKDQCVYDELCFEAGIKNLDEILREMDKTSIFVFFISNNSLESEWVKKELYSANERLNQDSSKLSQIFPIIIDGSVSHDDVRIPDYIRSGFSSYNLRVITNEQIAYRKIKAQQTKFLLERKLLPINQHNEYFYGRDDEISNFKKTFDSGVPIKCLVASGLTGIGRRSYLFQCLKKSQIIEEYYLPPIISLNKFDNIEDIIVKLSEVGFGEYSIESLTSKKITEEKIEILTNVLKVIQHNKEIVLIYDNDCLINANGDLAYWFEEALERIRNEITVLIASKNTINTYCAQKNKWLFFQDISVLPYSEKMGLMRVYGQSSGIELSAEDRAYFKDILTGYPPQVKYCIEFMKSNSVEYVKRNPHLIIDIFSQKSSEILNKAVPNELKDDAYGFLAFASSYGIVPTDLLSEVMQLNDNYAKVFSLFKTMTICRYLGINNEYIEVNPMITDYIQRGRFTLPAKIKDLLNSKLKKFNKWINSNPNSLSEDFETIKYYIKSKIIKGDTIPEKFMYSTVYLSSIYELYNHGKYKQVISLVEKLKENGSFERYDILVQAKIQGFYCRALARETNEKFYEEVEYFCNEGECKDINEYNFLRGFMFRHNSEYDKALERYKRVLEKQPKHRNAMREIVIVYRGLEDYESAYEYARENYLREPENPYQIQPYFEMLIRKNKNDINEEENNYIKEMIETIKRINASKPSSKYYEMLGQYAAYIEKDKERAQALLKEGVKKYPDSSYTVKTLFDCSELFNDIHSMVDALKLMTKFTSDNKSVSVAFQIRQALIYAYQNKPKDFIENYVNGINGLNNEAKFRLVRKVKSIQSAKYN